MSTELETNTSGQYLKSVVPDDVKKKFNWGAFFLSWIWGIGNNSFIPLIIFVTILFTKIPVVSCVLSLVLCVWFGIKGNEWAWRNKKFESIQAFHSYQKKWAIAGIIVALSIPLIFVVLGIVAMLALPALLPH